MHRQSQPIGIGFISNTRFVNAAMARQLEDDMLDVT